MTALTGKQVLRDFRTRSVLESTRRIIAAQGFDAVTMERVAAEAGITKGCIYLYFRNKDHLILAALEEIASEMIREVEGRIDSKAGPWGKVCQLVISQLETMERHKDVLRTILLIRWLLNDPRERKKWRRLLEYRQRHLKRIKAILDEGVRQKAFRRMDTGVAAFYINELAIGTAQKRMMGLSHAPLERDGRMLLRFLAPILCGRMPIWKSGEGK
ncbi:MAG: TetR/AcrR family transcriptional regulator [Deltaproteobacteria bacterium]|nr:TetR/AcrR family transcriptional regulator [Deltaproteobacteria bacterium]